MTNVAAERARWGGFFLTRLERLCGLEERFVSPPDVVADPRRLVNKAIFATYCQCVVLGHKAEAEHLLATRHPGHDTASSAPSQRTGPVR